MQDDRSALAEALAAEVLRHPGVVRLDGGPFGTVASYLPGRRLQGVRVGEGAEPVELAVVAALGVPLPRLADELGAIVRDLFGPVGVEVTVADVEPAATATGHGVMGGPQP
ncbi:hypothetical protein WEH80_07230 [Actinomycetes bacterium KLBMP 9759]